ncbi:MAG: O-antigen ligase family protein [Pseudomonadota bacterium]
MIRATPLALSLLGLSCGLIFLGQDLRFGVRIRAFDIGLIVVAALLIWQILSRGVRRDTGAFVLSFGAFALYVTCNALLQVSTGTAIKELIQLTFFLLFFLSLVQFIRTEHATKIFLIFFVATLCLLALHNGYFHLSRGSFAGWKDLGDRKLTHSVLFVVLVIISFSAFRPRRPWWTLLLVVTVVFLFLSGERKGWAAAIAATVIALMIADGGGVDRKTLRRVSTFILGGGALIALVALLSPYVPYLEKQLVSSVEFVKLLLLDTDTRRAIETTRSNEGRIVTIELALFHMRENPVFGLGPERFRAVSSGMAFLPIAPDDVKGAHNELLRIGAELGYVGLALYGLVNLVVAWRAMRLIMCMRWLDAAEQLRVRLGVGMFLFGFAVNVFLAGGGLNTFFLVFPAGLLFSVPLPAPGHLPFARIRSGSRPIFRHNPLVFR